MIRVAIESYLRQFCRAGFLGWSLRRAIAVLGPADPLPLRDATGHQGGDVAGSVYAIRSGVEAWRAF